MKKDESGPPIKSNDSNDSDSVNPVQNPDKNPSVIEESCNTCVNNTW